MPKLSELQTYDRLYDRLTELNEGKSFDTRTLGKLLTEKQLAELKDQIALGKKNGETVHSIQTEFFKNIVHAMQNESDNIANRMIEEVEIDAAKVFLAAYYDAQDYKKNAFAEANAALTRRGFKRIDDVQGIFKLTDRDQAILDVENELINKLEDKLSDAEREQLAWDRAVLAEIEDTKNTSRRKR